MSQSIQFGVSDRAFAEASPPEVAVEAILNRRAALSVSMKHLLSALAVTVPTVVGVGLVAATMFNRYVDSSMQAEMAQYAEPVPGYEQFVRDLNAQDVAAEVGATEVGATEVGVPQS